MGYTTDFTGRFNLNKKLKQKDYQFLVDLAGSRRMARNVGPEYGVEGEFYVGGAKDGDYQTPDVIDFNRPPKTQPSLWLQWVPTEDRKGLEWDGGEKFYSYVEWIKYLIDKVLEPRGYIVNGEVEWQGEDRNDMGKIIVKDNLVHVRQGVIVYR